MQFSLWQLILISYLLGSVPAAYIAANRTRGIDLRYNGSGNVGASNLMRFVSGRSAIPVIIFDLFKGGAIICLTKWLGFSLGSQMMVGIAAVCGHNWPIFLRFKGGRGVITTSAVVSSTAGTNALSSWEQIGLIATALCAVVFIHALFKKGPLGVFIGIASMPLISWILNAPPPFIQGCLALFGIFAVRRLTAKQPVTVESCNRRQLLKNRLLFDRDIVDIETWVAFIEKKGLLKS